MIEYPNIDPVLIEIGPLAIRWYSIAYVLGIVFGGIYADWLNKKAPVQKNLKVFDDFMMWAIIGIIIGGRFGYVLFYNFEYYIVNITEAMKIWQGGMSFHGGFLGVVVASVIFCKKNKVNLWVLFDLLACAAPIGLLFGRIANFINGELYGRVTDVSWAMVFPAGGPEPRHPSQLYEAFLEGLVLLVVLFFVANYTKLKQMPGVLAGIFVSGYAISRIIVENYREPDEHIGFLFMQITTGQALSFPMLAIGLLVIAYSYKVAKKKEPQ